MFTDIQRHILKSMGKDADTVMSGYSKFEKTAFYVADRIAYAVARPFMTGKIPPSDSKIIGQDFHRDDLRQ